MNTKDLTGNRKLLAMIIGVALSAAVGLSLAYAQTSGTTTEQTTTEQGSQGTTTQGSQGNAPPQIQGSVDLAQQVLSSVKTPFTEAANAAAGSVTNGQVIGGGLTVMQGYVVYNFKVVDGKNIYSVIVDAGNGKVLYTSQGHPIQIGSLFGMGHPRMGHSGMMHKSHNMAPRNHTNQPPASPPSGTQQ